MSIRGDIFFNCIPFCFGEINKFYAIEHIAVRRVDTPGYFDICPDLSGIKELEIKFDKLYNGKLNVSFDEDTGTADVMGDTGELLALFPAGHVNGELDPCTSG